MITRWASGAKNGTDERNSSNPVMSTPYSPRDRDPKTRCERGAPLTGEIHEVEPHPRSTLPDLDGIEANRRAIRKTFRKKAYERGLP